MVKTIQHVDAVTALVEGHATGPTPHLDTLGDVRVFIEDGEHARAEGDGVEGLTVVRKLHAERKCETLGDLIGVAKGAAVVDMWIEMNRLDIRFAIGLEIDNRDAILGDVSVNHGLEARQVFGFHVGHVNFAVRGVHSDVEEDRADVGCDPDFNGWILGGVDGEDILVGQVESHAR